MIAQTALLQDLFDWLWEGYRDRVSYARTYEETVARLGGTFRNDHVAFRTFATQDPWSGNSVLARPFVALGYRAAGTYDFPDKHLSSIHYAPPTDGLPKIFISQLRVWELSPRARKAILDNVRGTSPLGLGDAELADLARLPEIGARRRCALLKAWAKTFTRPWAPPSRASVLALEKESQFGAWVLLHGHAVNHFTAAVHSHHCEALGDIEKTVAALKAAGVPMKPEIEGAAGTRLRQSSTEAATIPVEMRVGRRAARFPWTYAYFELAERPLVDGERFEGFLGGQAANLFEMTKRR